MSDDGRRELQQRLAAGVAWLETHAAEVKQYDLQATLDVDAVNTLAAELGIGPVYTASEDEAARTLLVHSPTGALPVTIRSYKGASVDAALTNATADNRAVTRAIEFLSGWFALAGQPK